MRPLYLLSLLLCTALSVLPTHASLPSTCLTGSTPFQLATECAPGYYCPLYNASDPTTYPVQCAATNDCLLDRLATKFCEPQGTYEPRLCPAGSYCPTPTSLLPCPEGHVCPLGTQTPIACGPMTSCPEGTKKKHEWGSAIALLVSDLGMLGLWFAAKKWRQYQLARRDAQFQSSKVVSVNRSLEAKGSLYHQLPEDLKFLCHGFSRARQALPPMRIEFSELSLTIPAKGTKPAKTILKGVTGSIEAAKVTAIMGPSGAGKTTFLHTLLDKTDPTWVRGGSLKINGAHEELSRFRKVIGYVPQDDIMHQDLSIFDNVSYSAHVRLPRDWTAEQREEHINAVISAMQLTDVQDIRIGDAAKRGVSGGQRKRCNIGMEVAAAPSLLLLDEPTSGLDSTSAMEICKVIKDLTRVSSLTVAMVIHQPRVEIWNQLDEVLLLAPGGLTVYQGPQRLAVAYFAERLDVHFEPNDNPADALMDRIAESADEFVQSWKEGGPAYLEALKARHSQPAQQAPSAGSAEAALLAPSALPSLQDTRIVIQNAWEVELTPPSALKAVEGAQPFPPFPPTALRQSAGFLTQVWLAFCRNLWKQAANLPSLCLETGLGMLAAVAMGAMVTVKYQGILSAPYTLLSPTPLTSLIPSLFFNVGLSMSLAAATAGVSVFGEEQVIYRREVASGHSHPAYYLGVTLAQFPRLYCDAIHFAFCFHNINQPFSSFAVWLPITFLLYVAIYGLAAIVSMLVSRKNAPLLGVVLCLFFSSMTGKGGFPEPIQYLSAARWAVEALFSVETEPFRHYMNVANNAEKSGYVLDRVPVDMAIMLFVGCFYRVLAYVAMVWADRKLLFK